VTYISGSHGYSWLNTPAAATLGTYSKPTRAPEKFRGGGDLGRDHGDERQRAIFVFIEAHNMV
jgi:hypothetical protein